ncbi:MAG: carboxypeptidase-like regulatory domain-containing protein [Candidatus Fimivivens sp.]|nr:carboxypeptidase-like regulatory domain-containing protein [Candidatus Fimivivens sp.]
MPQKSFEQYERELMEMYRLALAKDPNYAALAKRHSQATLEDRISEEKKIDVEIPAPTVEEAVPLPEGITPVAEETAPEAPIMPTMPTTPRTPAMPETSTTPTMPAMPRTPVMPEASTTPTMPTTPRTPAPQQALTLPKLPVSVLREPLEPGVATLQLESFESPALAVVLPVPDTISQTAVKPEPQTRSQAQTLRDAQPGSTNLTQMQPDANSVPTNPLQQQPPIQQQPPTAQKAPSGTQTAPTMPRLDEMRRAMSAPNMGAGNLIVDVTTQNRTKPVMGAVVTVTHSEESGNKVVAKATTDNSGKTEPIRLPAPIREIPVYPQPMIGGDLSAQYLVTVESPGFESATDEEISIFDGVTSVKRIDLVSEADSENSAADENLNDDQRE